MIPVLSTERGSALRGQDTVQELQRDFETARASAVSSVRDYGLASFGLRLWLADTVGLEQLTSALRHLGPPQQGVHRLQIRVWSGAPPQVIEEARAVLKDRKQVSVLGDRIHMSVELGGQALSVYDRKAQRGYFWCRDSAQLPGYMIANPFRLILHWWLQSTSMQFVHAAAVGHSGQAALIVGNSGVGKSTTALACVQSGLDYLADDYCICSIEQQPQVYSVYQSAKIERANLSTRLHTWSPHVVNPGEADKAVVLVDKVRPSQLRTRAGLAALLVPSFESGGKHGISSASKLDALRALAPSSLIQMPGQGAADFRALRSLVERVPAYQLRLSPDLGHNAKLIGNLLSQL